MLKPFFMLVVVLVLSVMAVIVDYIVYDKEAYKDANRDITSLTNFSTPSLSVAYYEPRVLFYESASNPAYPQMQPINKMDFIYEK